MDISCWINPQGVRIDVKRNGHRDWLRANTNLWDEDDLLKDGWVKVSYGEVYHWRLVNQAQLDCLFDAGLMNAVRVVCAGSGY